MSLKWTRERRVDLLNLGLIGAAFLLVVWLVPPVRDFPMDDDWVYAGSVQDLLRGDFQVGQWAQAIALGHEAWAALLAYFLGFSFTTLSIANLAMGLAGLALFYLLLRQLGIRPNYALFGVATLGLNPMYFYLSYSFMTDVSFVTFTLAAMLCFVLAFNSPAVREGWLWWGSAASALAYLNRQFGVLVPAAVLLYMWAAREWGWRRVAAVVLIPVAAAAGYALWEGSQPTRLVLLLIEQQRAYAFENPGQAALLRVFEIVYTVAIPGLCLLPLLFLRVRPRYPLVAFAVLAALQVYVLRASGTVLPVVGNVVDHSGFFSSYEALWPQWIWAGIALLGGLTLCLFVGSLMSGIRPGAIRDAVRGKAEAGRTVEGDPAHIAYILLVLLVPATLFLPTMLFDRYFLPMFPLLIFAALRYLQRSAPSPPWWRWALLVPFALFSLIGMRDLFEFYDLRWERAEALVARSGVAHRNIDAGYEWVGWHLFDEAEPLVRQSGDYSNMIVPGRAALDPVYRFSNMPIEGYEQVDSLAYRYWLAGGLERRLLLLKRSGD
ncbi:MAG TPA: glycosyltransferase family 39 protein [Chloroflexia bacterium]|nr:glycosyltransferase family 39 protein [Chloroflexia bacterium]